MTERVITEAARKAAVESRSQLIVERAANEKTSELSRVFGGTTEVDGTDIKAFIDKFRELQIEFHLSLRDAGELNDDSSVEQGVAVYIDLDAFYDPKDFDIEEAKFRLQEIIELYQGTIDQGEGNIIIVHLPQGIFSTVEDQPGEVFVYGDCDTGPSGLLISGEPFKILSKANIVRIEGYSGELWQNPAYTPDG